MAEKEKIELHLAGAGDGGLSLDDISALYRSLTGRVPTAEEVEEARAVLDAKLVEKAAKQEPVKEPLFFARPTAGITREELAEGIASGLIVDITAERAGQGPAPDAEGVSLRSDVQPAGRPRSNPAMLTEEQSAAFDRYINDPDLAKREVLDAWKRANPDGDIAQFEKEWEIVTAVFGL